MAEQKPKFDVLYSEEADAFLSEQTDKVRAKILYNVHKASVSNDPKLFKKLENTDIWEFRTLFDNIQYRLLAFWDKRDGRKTLVIATHGFVKKSQKTPPQEIHHAQSIKDIYFNQK
jgi:phage-related protein